METGKHKLSAGDWIEVRSKEEILKTLDSKGQLDGMPFMPEMLSFCGRRMQVYKRAHKTCDTVFPVRGRRVDRAVHLETRCDGSAHGGCEAGCLLFWKEEWLKPVAGDPQNSEDPSFKENSQEEATPAGGGCTEFDVWSNVSAPSSDDGAPIYKCQATRLPYATTDLAWWDIRQYIEDYTSGNAGLWRIFRGLVYAGYYNLSQAGIGLGRPMRWFYDKTRRLWGGPVWPRKQGTIPKGKATPTANLHLQPGELVRVKSHDKILRTVTTEGRNRGMTWDAELVPYCGGTYRVLRRVTKIVNEQTGKMQEMQNPCIILDSVVCKARYSGCRMFCPREIYSWWREIWLERVESSVPAIGGSEAPELCSNSTQMTTTSHADPVSQSVARYYVQIDDLRHRGKARGQG
jgi:hypothetical protein